MSAAPLHPTVTGDHSLDDFLDAGGSEDADESGDPDRADAETSGPESAPDPDEDGDVGAELTDDRNLGVEEVDPAEPTYDWSPDGADCAACGGTVTTRWRQDGAYVCADCKEW